MERASRKHIVCANPTKPRAVCIANSAEDTCQQSLLASTKPGVIDTREVSCFCGRNCQCFSTNCHVFSEEGDEDPDRTEATIEVGQWVLVEYDGDLFPGTVTQVLDQGPLLEEIIVIGLSEAKGVVSLLPEDFSEYSSPPELLEGSAEELLCQPPFI
ncbi:hypothetical protein QQF64_024021 [Cirrhinus molitorella]|uniref:Lipoyl-binding domain-containing protein n=1 Tax=Cirrhinus molitorella TaxID=172907 RepID=A0ABR3NK18_9TELE